MCVCVCVCVGYICIWRHACEILVVTCNYSLNIKALCICSAGIAKGHTFNVGYPVLSDLLLELAMIITSLTSRPLDHNCMPSLPA